MNRHKPVLVFLLALGACASMPCNLEDWAGFADGADHLSPEELRARISSVAERYETSPDDLTRLQLAYLLSRPAPATLDVEAGRQLLDEIDSESAYSSLRDLVRRQIEAEARFRSARREVQERNAEIELLQEQIGKLEPRVDREAEVQLLRDRVRELESKLEALKSIEAQMSKGQKALDELPDD